MSDTQLIKDKIDVVDLINEYVQLKPAGINHKGLCPFHQEKSPSFMVNRERQNWHCFGCNKGGDIFTFIQDIEGMDFVEALKFLANRAGVQLTRQVSDVNSSQKNRIKDINQEAARFFHKFLREIPASKPAIEYLHERGLTDDTIDTWQIGFVPDQWDLLTRYLLKKGHAVDDLVAAGLTIKRDGADARTGRGFYDRFRGRIMFPIWDVHDHVVGFTGRVLVETENSGGKYVNTPQTLVYDKSRVIFGLNKAKQEIRKKDLIVMVEGQMDVIACHQAGMTNVVASSGTALTEQQVQLLKRYSQTMYMAFDADQAGQAAAKRGIDIALAEGIGVRVIRIPEGKGKDPDECLQLNKEVWFKAVEDAQDIISWYLDKAFAQKDISQPKEKQAIVDEVLPEIMRIPYAVERDHWMRELSARLGVDIEVLREDGKRLKNAESGKRKAEKESDVPGGRQKKATEVKSPESAESVLSTRMTMLLEQYFALLLRFPDTELSVWLNISDFIAGPHQPLYEALHAVYTAAKALEIDALRKKLEKEGTENPVDVLLMKGELDFVNIQESDAKNELLKLKKHITAEWEKQRRALLQQQIAQAEKEGNTDLLNTLLIQLQSLST